jgi:methylmalonyl-CoA/ethylmalonyl-CoA epimerase
MILRIDHVSIAVKDQQKAEHFFRDILGAVAGTNAADPATRYFWQLFSLGDLSRLEIISPTGPGSFLDGFLKSKEAGVHHITLQTPDIRKAMAHLDAHGIPFFGYNEYPGGVWTEIFIHPRHAFGVLIQIAQFEADDWLSEQVKFPAGTKWQVEKTPTGANLIFAHPGGGKVSLELDRKELTKLTAALDHALQ